MDTDKGEARKRSFQLCLARVSTFDIKFQGAVHIWKSCGAITQSQAKEESGNNLAASKLHCFSIIFFHQNTQWYHLFPSFSIFFIILSIIFKSSFIYIYIYIYDFIILKAHHDAIPLLQKPEMENSLKLTAKARPWKLVGPQKKAGSISNHPFFGCFWCYFQGG